MNRSMPSLILALALAASTAAPGAAAATREAPSGLSDLSRASLVPVAVVLAAPSALLAGGAVLTVRAVEASADGTVWVLERASDGAQASLRMSGVALSEAAALAGSVLEATVVAAGVLLSQGERVVAFVPNPRGATLMFHARLPEGAPAGDRP